MARRESDAGSAAAAKAGAKKAAKKAAAGKAGASAAAAKRAEPKTAGSKPAAAKVAALKTATAKPPVAKKTSAKKTAPASAPARPKPSAKPAAASAPAATTFPREPRVDAYIAQAAPFAQPILRELRERVHAACAEAQEAIKWGMPFFIYRGKILCAMAAFKQHASFGFWQGPSIVGTERSADSGAMGQFGRLTALADLPGRRELAAMLKQAMALIETGAKQSPSKSGQPKPRPRPPADLAAALAGNAAARKTFDGFPPSQQREYVEWVETAKREETRRARVAQAVEWMAQGKARNWKYMAK